MADLKVVVTDRKRPDELALIARDADVVLARDPDLGGYWVWKNRDGEYGWLLDADRLDAFLEGKEGPEGAEPPRALTVLVRADGVEIPTDALATADAVLTLRAGTFLWEGAKSRREDPLVSGAVGRWLATAEPLGGAGGFPEPVLGVIAVAIVDHADAIQPGDLEGADVILGHGLFPEAFTAAHAGRGGMVNFGLVGDYLAGMLGMTRVLTPYEVDESWKVVTGPKPVRV